MSLNNNYVNKPSEKRVQAKFYSVSLQDQIDELRADISILTDAVDKLVQLHETEHTPTNTDTDPTPHEIEDIHKLKEKHHSQYIQ